MTASLKIDIVHFYPDLLNLYGDRGNLIAWQKRCEWRGIDCRLHTLSLKEPFKAADYDLAFLGGGQDYEQGLLQQDLLNEKGPAIRDAVEDGFVFLCICGGFQLMGQYYQDAAGKQIECLGALDLYTVAGKTRLIGDSVSESPFLAAAGKDPTLVGFENHGGRTWLGKQVKPLAKVIRGSGNNGDDKQEGAMYKNTYCTYYHGSFLPKNPDMADYLLEKALVRRYSEFEKLEKLANVFEDNARNYIKACK